MIRFALVFLSFGTWLRRCLLRLTKGTTPLHCMCRMQVAAALTLTAGMLLTTAQATAQGEVAGGELSSGAATHISEAGRGLLFQAKDPGDDAKGDKFSIALPPLGSPDNDDGNEGNEGDEGDEGGFVKKSSGTTESSASCTTTSSGTAYAYAESAHLSAVAAAFATACAPGYTGVLDDLKDKYGTLAAVAVAQAVADASAECTSNGKAFGCAKAEAAAASWAAATAEAHAHAVSEALGGCGSCHGTAVEVQAAAENLAASFVQLTADVFARAEVVACVRGDQAASAEAFSNCFAEAYAQVFARASAYALIEGKCLSEDATVKVQAATKAEFSESSSCDVFDSASGNASGDTSGSAADAVRSSS